MEKQVVSQGVSKQGRTRVCGGGCGRVLIKTGFSSTQWRKADAKCLSCVVLPSPVLARAAPSPTKTNGMCARPSVDTRPCLTQKALPVSLPLSTSLSCARPLSPSGAMTLFPHLSISGQQLTHVPLENQPKSNSTTVSPPCAAFSSPKNSYTSQQNYSMSCARSGVSPVEWKSGNVGGDTVCASEAEAGSLVDHEEFKP